MQFCFWLSILAVGLIPSAGAQDDAPWCGTDENVEITFIAGTVGGEHEVYVKLADRFTAEVCPNITVKVVERPESTTETLAQYQQFFEGTKRRTRSLHGRCGLARA